MSSQPLLQSITQTRSAGVNQQNFRPFNDIVDVGGFPVTQTIQRISFLQIWGRDRVEGIQVTYVVSGTPSTHRVILHGRASGYVHPAILLNDRQFIVGVFGRRNAGNNIGSISFLVFQEDNGRVEVQGPFGSPPRPGTAFGTFGRVVAFAGTTEDAFGLCALSMIKSDSLGHVFL